MKYGYARVSSQGQKLQVQLDLLKQAGCEEIFSEKKSGKNKFERAEFERLLETVKEGDVIVVSKLDRFARSTRDALNTIHDLDERRIGLVILNLGGDILDTTTAIGKLMVTVLSGISEFELSLIKDRQKDGIKNARKANVKFGRPKKYGKNHASMAHAIELYNQGEKTVKQICEITKVSRSALYREIKRLKPSAM